LAAHTVANGLVIQVACTLNAFCFAHLDSPPRPLLSQLVLGPLRHLEIINSRQLHKAISQT
jgi:hypothetical protein